MGGELTPRARTRRNYIIGTTCLLFVVLASTILYKIIWPASTDNKLTLSAAPLPVIPANRWQAPAIQTLPDDSVSELIRYGKDLVTHTAQFIGPSGKLKINANGMNCQNCHLEGGTRYLGNNYSAVASTYPKFRARSGSIETIEKRVNDCIERSLNGEALRTDSREMRAFVAYIEWVGSTVPDDVVPEGAGLYNVRFLERAADPEKGKIAYEKYCARCHGLQGEGKKNRGDIEWVYPPLWGEQSYNTGAGLYRLSRMAGYVKMNMPFDLASPDNPLLTDEEAWDVSAYINSLPRPMKKFANDWPDISKKPFDHPFGPYADSFSEKDHKYGPFARMSATKK